jgi:flagellar biogenesis protein FliO
MVTLALIFALIVFLAWLATAVNDSITRRARQMRASEVRAYQARRKR